MQLIDSRRLTGPTRFWNLPGAVVDIACPKRQGDDEATATKERLRLVEIWSRWAREILDAVGWQEEHTTSRVFGDGLSLVLSAPLDALYAATEINEWAVAAALAERAGDPIPDLNQAALQLRRTIEAEQKPTVLELQQAAADHGVLFLSDDDYVSVGSGQHSHLWPIGELPKDASEVDWTAVQDVPIAAITGTNGKSTTVRLLSAMATAHGLTPGVSSTDWVRVGDEVLEDGDYSGPGGARTILRDRRVDIAILETARGGLNRRGLAVPTVDVAAITNIGADHLGEHGSSSLDDLADVKFVLARVARHLILNFDDPLLRIKGREIQEDDRPQGSEKKTVEDRTITWCSLQNDDPAQGHSAKDSAMAAHIAAGGTACILKDHSLFLVHDHVSTRVAGLENVPSTLNGAARHNVANALTAIGVAAALGWPVSAMRRGLNQFLSKPEDNPGRLNRFVFSGLQVVVDFAHNPDGVRALLELGKALEPERFLIVLGQAGDRDDNAIRALAKVVAPFQPNRIVIKELHTYLRGRQVGVIPQVIQEELVGLGIDPGSIVQVDSELDALRDSLAWGQPGDLVFLITHSDRELVLEALTRLQTEDWQAQSALPNWL